VIDTASINHGYKWNQLGKLEEVHSVLKNSAVKFSCLKLA